MAKTILVCGYGPGISASVARRFGREGYAVALVSRTPQRLAEGVAELEGAGVTAKAFPCDLADAGAVREVVSGARAALGPIGVVHWNACEQKAEAGDLATCDPGELRRVLDVGVHSLVTAAQAALSDLKSEKGSILITGGGLAYFDREVDADAVREVAMGLALAKAAQHKLAGLLHHRLGKDGVYVGEVTVLGAVRGTALDTGLAMLEPDEIADKFWNIHKRRDDVWVKFG